MAQNDVEQLADAAARIRRMRLEEGLTWREIAATGEFGNVSHATLREVARGHTPSAATCRAMGVRKTNRWRLHYEAGRGEKGRERYERVKAFLKTRKYENLTELVDELMEGAGDDNIKGKE